MILANFHESQWTLLGFSGLEADIHGFQWSLLDGNIAQSVGDKHQLEMPEKTDVCAHKCRASTISNTSFVENLGHQVIQFWIIGN